MLLSLQTPTAADNPPCSQTWRSRSDRCGSEGSTDSTLKITSPVSTICAQTSDICFEVHFESWLKAICVERGGCSRGWRSSK